MAFEDLARHIRGDNEGRVHEPEYATFGQLLVDPQGRDGEPGELIRRPFRVEKVVLDHVLSGFVGAEHAGLREKERVGTCSVVCNKKWDAAVRYVVDNYSITSEYHEP